MGPAGGGGRSDADGAEESGPAMSREGDAAVAEGATTVRRGEESERGTPSCDSLSLLFSLLQLNINIIFYLI
jgi:hypothetical protein